MWNFKVLGAQVLKFALFSHKPYYIRTKGVDLSTVKVL